MIHFNRKALLSLVLALVLALCAAMPAMAEEAAPIDLNGKLVILHTNDMHGSATSEGTTFGYSRIAALKAQLASYGASVLLLDAGDYSQGAPIVNLSNGKSAIDFMNAAGYDAATLGNHEFDWGTDNLLQNLEGAAFTVLCANIVRTAGGDAVFAPNKIFETGNGMKVGVFGLDTPETQTKAHPDKVKGIDFIAGEEMFKLAQAQVDELKAAGCDLIVCLGHLGVDDESAGNRSTDLLKVVTGIDLFIDGHSHTAFPNGQQEGDTLLVSTGSNGAAAGVVVVDKEQGILSASLYNGVNAEVEDQVKAVKKAVEEELSAVFATTSVDLNGERSPGVRTEETNLGDFAADAILWAAKQAVGEDNVVAALTNGGGIRASIKAGDVTMLDMKTVFPFGNEVATLTITGAELLEALEAATFSAPEALGAFPQVAGIVFTLDTTVPYEQGDAYPDSTYFAPKAPGARVTIESVGGEPFDAEKSYTIATNDFTAAGGDTYYVFRYAWAATGYKTGVALEDALVNYTQTVLGGAIGDTYAAPQGRIVIK